jgi:crotonobetainyl-CoA:carnitine CoA-transferase CaiB-like acyl-CoA transferase
MHNVFPRMSATPGEIQWGGRTTIGADNETIYCGELGLSKEEFEQLKSKGII